MDLKKEKLKTDWKNLKVGITGASGSLGLALSKNFRSKGCFVIGLTHKEVPKQLLSNDSIPNQWVRWNCGEEAKLDDLLKTLDLLILNHGINPGANLDSKALNKALEVNALSYWRLMERFEEIVLNQKENTTDKELWVNTSEAEIQPAFSPSYEISKRLIGQLVSFKTCSLTQDQKLQLKIKKIILGPFKSKLNPIGLMKADLVAEKIINQASIQKKLIIVSPNPITYFLIPINELLRSLYFQLFKNNNEES